MIEEAIAPDGWPDPLAPDELAGRVCLVTGAAQGIGACIAWTLGQLGAVVAVTDLNLDGARARADELRVEGVRAEAFGLDVRDSEAVDATVAAVESTMGDIDVLVNNAGLAVITPTLESLTPSGSCTSTSC